MKFLSVVGLTLWLCSMVYCHARWVYPAPRSSDSGLKTYPCGGISGSTPTTTINPSTGLIELKWEETITHTGAPFAIAISQDGSTFYTLLDHIPHQDIGSASFTNTKKYSLSISLPNINCPHCILQLVNPMTDKITEGTCCKYYPNSNSNAFHNSASPICFSVYHSCADIKLIGTESFSNFVANRTNIGLPCGDYMTQASSQWVVGVDGYNRLNGFNGTNIQNYVVNTCSSFSPVCSISSGGGGGGGDGNPSVNGASAKDTICIITLLVLVMIFFIL